MYLFTYSLILFAFLASVTSITPQFNPRAFEHVAGKRHATENLDSNNLVVDLGYERYQGFYNTSAGLNNWLGYERETAPSI